MSLTFDQSGHLAHRSRPALWRRILDRLMAARLAEAQHAVNLCLSKLDDDELARLGYRRTDLAAMRDRSSRF
ncbi:MULTISPECIES: hypothetical protein [Hyphomicrobiales]|uniref:DUF1127 domain-containing protein n=2 Tax=Hyphomicrobiales TaxID=356 RepID=A0A1G5N5T5_AFIMA|nr:MULTISPECIES: hypothetical protein [Hyphomicrobiales]MBK1626862.1 hypothetical protein [Afifella marina]MBK5919208.1 hypothetical protein [Afifella marina]MDQ0326673.1 hypothetical protein [Rhodopseudomonas julia]RAI21251.1 hypothetical protein CH311_07175 [Afifella marina DSM 2698]SCZ32030.1 hypothetical protein SAMN03080610_01461 [Afifella marina DSM 2698]